MQDTQQNATAVFCVGVVSATIKPFWRFNFKKDLEQLEGVQEYKSQREELSDNLNIWPIRED